MRHPFVENSCSGQGELLALLTTRELSRSELRKRFLADGVPNLWIPKVAKRIEPIPVLGTGKVDLEKCRHLAMGQ
jgi:acyl-[acyl-carrier-protein]-phospholipid O-acyltransferase/long-chain-fatty-acid--[acyl-carrier-protein] ligase